MAYSKIHIHKINLAKMLNTFEKRFPEESKHLREFLRLLSVGEINRGKVIGERRQLRYVNLLTIFFRHMHKVPLGKLSKNDMLDFVDKLNKDKIKRLDGRPYSDSSKVDIKICLRTYLKWRLPGKHLQLTDWFDLRLSRTTPEYLTEAEVAKLLDASPTIADKFLVCVLFDGGMRAEEFLNIRREDIIEPTESFPYYKIDVKQEYSKTAGRTVGLYWKHSTRIVREYMAQSDSHGREPIYTRNYGAIRMYLTRLGNRVLKKRVYCHLFRKSSATYYASRLNRQQLCVRYGWKFSSDMPDVYIRRAGVEEDQVKEKMLSTNLQQMEKENQELRTKFALMQESSEKQIGELGKKLGDLQGGRGLMSLLLSLSDQQRKMGQALQKLTGKKFDVVLPPSQKRPRRAV